MSELKSGECVYCNACNKEITEGKHASVYGTLTYQYGGLPSFNEGKKFLHAECQYDIDAQIKLEDGWTAPGEKYHPLSR